MFNTWYHCTIEVRWPYTLCISQFHPRPQPRPRGYCGAFTRLFSPVDRAFANFALPGDRAFANPRAIPELLTLAVCYQNMTTQKVSLEKKQTGSSVKDRNNLKRVVKACSGFYACISSLLIKPKLLQSEIGAIDVNQRFFRLILFEEHPFILMKLFITYNFTALY